MNFTDYDTRIAAYALIIDEGRVLLSWFNGLRHPERASWTLPGGGVEFGEALEGAVLREVFEETGYRIELDGYLTSRSFGTTGDEDGRAKHIVGIIFLAHVVGGTLGTVEVGGSTDRAEWIPLDQLDAAGPRVEGVNVALAAWQGRGRPSSIR